MSQLAWKISGSIRIVIIIPHSFLPTRRCSTYVLSNSRLSWAATLTQWGALCLRLADDWSQGQDTGKLTQSTAKETPEICSVFEKMLLKKKGSRYILSTCYVLGILFTLSCLIFTKPCRGQYCHHLTDRLKWRKSVQIPQGHWATSQVAMLGVESISIWFQRSNEDHLRPNDSRMEWKKAYRF